jgi:hypothetical protein
MPANRLRFEKIRPNYPQITPHRGREGADDEPDSPIDRSHRDSSRGRLRGGALSIFGGDWPDGRDFAACVSPYLADQSPVWRKAPIE